MPSQIKDLVVRFREAGLSELQGSVGKAAKKAGDSLDVLVRKAHETAAQLDAINAGRLSLDIPVKDIEQKMSRLLSQIRVKTDQELKKLGVTSEAVFSRIAEQSAQIGATIRETGLTTGIDNLRLSAALLEKQLLADTVAARKLGIALQNSFAIDNLKARAAFETIASSKTASDLDKLRAKLALVKNGLLEDEAAARKLGTTLRATFATELAEKRLALATLQRAVAPSIPLLTPTAPAPIAPIAPSALPAEKLGQVVREEHAQTQELRAVRQRLTEVLNRLVAARQAKLGAAPEGEAANLAAVRRAVQQEVKTGGLSANTIASIQRNFTGAAEDFRRGLLKLVERGELKTLIGDFMLATPETRAAAIPHTGRLGTGKPALIVQTTEEFGKDIALADKEIAQAGAGLSKAIVKTVDTVAQALQLARQRLAAALSQVAASKQAAGVAPPPILPPTIGAAAPPGGLPPVPPIIPAAVPADIRAGQLAVAKAALAELQGQASQLGVKLQASFKLAAAEARHLVLTLKEIGGTTAIDRLRAAAALLKAELAGASAAAQRLGFTLGRSFDVSRGETRAAAREVRESPAALPSDKLKAIAAEESAEFARAKEAADRLGVSLASTARITRQDLVAAFVALKETGKATDLEVRAAEANILAHDLNALAPAAQKVGVTLSHSFDAAAVSLKTFFAQLRAAPGLSAFDKVLVDVRENQVAFAGLQRAASTLGVTLSRSFTDVRRTAQAAFEEIQKSTAAAAVDKLRAEARNLEVQLEEVAAAANVLGVSLERAFAVRQAQARAAAATVAASPLATPADISAAGAAAVGLKAKEALDTASKSAQTFGITLGASARRGVTEAVAEFAKLKAAAAAGIVSPVELIHARTALAGMTAEAAKSGTKLRSLGEAFGFANKESEGGRNAFRRYTGYLASLTFEVTGAVFGLTAFGAALIAPFAAIGQVGGKFQQINQTLLSLGDSAEEAARGTEFFKEFFLSDVQQFTLDPLLNAFIKLKASGIDPLQGALLTLTDTISATGGGEQQLEKAALAISQIASKTRATAEEISGQLAEAIPGVIKKAAAANDQTVAQFLAAMQKGAVGARGFLENLFNELNRQFAGSGERLSGTFQGMINTLTKEWTRFLTLLGDAGLFREINAALKGFVDSLEAARADGSFQKFVADTAAGLKVFGQGLLITIGFIKEWGGTILTVIATLVGASVFKGLASIVGGIAKLFATTLPAALAAFRANATLAGGAFVLLRTLGLGAIGPAGWLVALALVFYDLAKAVFGAEQKVDALGNRLQQLKDTKISFGGNLQAEVDENVKALTVLESRLRITQEALAQSFPVAGRGGISPLRDQLAANRKEIEKEIDTRKGIIKELQAQIIEAPKKVGGFEGIAPFDVSTVGAGEGAADQLRKAQLAAQLKGVEDRIKLTREGLDRERRELEEGYASHLVSTKKFYEERTRITVAALETERELIAEKIRFEELALPGAKDEAERVNLQANINSLKSEQLIIESKIGEEIARGSKDSIKALDALSLRLARIDDEIAEMEGRPSGSARQKFIEEYKDDVAELTAQLNEAIEAGDELSAGRARVGLAQFERLTVNKTSVQDLQELQDKFSKIQESAAQQEARISAETATALFPEFIARQRQVEVIKEQVAALEALRAEALAQQAINPNIPDIGNFLADIETQISVLRSSTNLLAIELNSALATNLVSVFDDLTDGIGSAGDAMDKFGKDFLGTVRKIIIDNFVRQLFGGILGGEPSSISQPTGTGSGIVNLLSSLVGISPKTPEGKEKGLEDVTRANPLPVAVVEGGLAGATQAAALGVLPGQGPLGLAGGLLGGTGPLTIDQILAGAGAPGGAPIEEGIAGAAESGGFFASILSGFKGFFGGLFNTLGGALKGLFGKGGEIFSSILGIFSGLFHTGGVVGDAPRETRLVPLRVFANAARMHSGGLVGVRSNERPIIAQVGEEVLSRDNPRHRDNRGGAQNLAINIHPRALHMTLKDWLEGELGAIAAAR